MKGREFQNFFKTNNYCPKSDGVFSMRHSVYLLENLLMEVYIILM